MASRKRAVALALRLTAVVVAVGVLPLAGCGDPDDSTTSSSSSKPPTTAAPTTAPAGEQVEVGELDAGMCFDYRDVQDDEGAVVEGVFRIDCALPHDNEIFAVVTHPAGRNDPYPGDDALVLFADELCFGGFEAFVGKQYELSDLDIGHIRPSGDSWADRDRTVYCFVFQREGEKLTGTAQNSKR